MLLCRHVGIGESAMDNNFLSLDELDGSLSARRSSDLFSAIDLGASLEAAKKISASTSSKAYRKLTSHANITSYSLLSQLHDCPRKFELEKLQANTTVLVDAGPVNLDFAFGHAVGAGIQTFAATQSLVSAQLAAFLAWKADWDAEKLDKNQRPTGKSLAHAMIAVEKFQYFWDRELAEWEVVRLSSGKLATELAFAVDFQNGKFYFGHIDTVLQHKTGKQLAVWEGKTTGWSVNEATYGNSNQALGYSVVVDKIAEEIGANGNDYDVLYIIYDTKNQAFTLMPFHKTRTQRAEWLQDVLLDHANIATYQRIGFYPKRGESCVSKFGYPCNWYGTCQMSNSSLFPGVTPPELGKEEVNSVEDLDFVFTLDELIATQKGKG